MSCGVGRGCGSDPMLLWLWCRLTATARIRPLAWEPSYASGAALKKKKKKTKSPSVFFPPILHHLALIGRHLHQSVSSPFAHKFSLESILWGT